MATAMTYNKMHYIFFKRYYEEGNGKKEIIVEQEFEKFKHMIHRGYIRVCIDKQFGRVSEALMNNVVYFHFGMYISQLKNATSQEMYTTCVMKWKLFFKTHHKIEEQDIYDKFKLYIESLQNKIYYPKSDICARAAKHGLCVLTFEYNDDCMVCRNKNVKHYFLRTRYNYAMCVVCNESMVLKYTENIFLNRYN